MKTLIIGSNGFIGKRLSALLIEKGMEVVGFSSTNGMGINPETGLLSESFAIPGGTEAVVYLAQSPFSEIEPLDISHLMNVNVISALKAAELSSHLRVKRFIYASTGNVYDPRFDRLSENAHLRRDNWYSLSKIHAEEGLRLFQGHTNIMVGRLFGIYGPGQNGKLVAKILCSILNGKEVYIERNRHDASDLSGLKISLCYIQDAVEILYKLIVQGGPDFINIAGDRPVSIREMATRLAEYSGKECRIKILDSYRNFDLIADIRLLQNTFHPIFTSLEDGLRTTVAHALEEIRPAV